MKKFSKEKTLRDYSRDSFSYGNDMAKKAKGYVLTAAATYAFVKKGEPLVKELIQKVKGG